VHDGKSFDRTFRATARFEGPEMSMNTTSGDLLCLPSWPINPLPWRPCVPPDPTRWRGVATAWSRQ
jgi:hypothetical protein